MKIYTVVSPPSKASGDGICAAFYRLEKGGLTRIAEPPNAELMGISEMPSAPEDWGAVARAVAAECGKMRYRGVFTFYDGPQDELLKSPALRGYLKYHTSPEPEEGCLVIPSRLSGGSFRDMLSAFSGRKTALRCLEMSKTFPMPSSAAEGRRTTPEERAALLKGCATFLSSEMLCKYFTYMGPNGPRYCLFDDAESFSEKAECARRAGFEAVFK